MQVRKALFYIHPLYFIYTVHVFNHQKFFIQLEKWFHLRGITTNSRTNQPQTAEQINHKQPNKSVTNSRTNQPQTAEQINHKQPNKSATNSRKASFHIENQLNITIFSNV